MSNIYTYNVLPLLTPEDNNSYVNKRVIKLKACIPTATQVLESTWNYIKCTDDECYYQPWVEGDIIYRQHNITGISYVNAMIVLYDAATDMPFNYSIAPVIGEDDQDNKYLNVKIDTSLLTTKCFYYGVYLFNCTIDEAALATCIASHKLEGQSTEEATFNCYNDNCSNKTIIFSEPFQEEKCLNTLLVKGQYVTYDCIGQFYGDFVSGTNEFVNEIRVYGEIVKDGYTFTETIQNNSKKSSKQVATYNFRTPRIPPYVADQLAVCWNSKQLNIDGTDYKKTSDLGKNNDTGLMWIINTSLTIECDEINFTCN